MVAQWDVHLMVAYLNDEFIVALNSLALLGEVND